MTDAWTETMAKIDALRAKGATRMKIDGVEVEFGPPTAPPLKHEPLSAGEVEAAAKAKREEDEETLFWSAQ